LNSSLEIVGTNIGFYFVGFTLWEYNEIHGQARQKNFAREVFWDFFLKNPRKLKKVSIERGILTSKPHLLATLLFKYFQKRMRLSQTSRSSSCPPLNVLKITHEPITRRTSK